MLRLSIVASVLVVLVAGAAMLHSGPSAPISAAGISYESLPGDVVLVIHADVASLMDSELYRSLAERWAQEAMPPNAKYQEFVEATGFRLETDLKSLTVGVGQNPGNDSTSFYALVSGNFDRQKVDAFIQDSGEYERTEVEGLTAFVGTTNQEGVQVETTMAWFDDNTLLLASTPDFGKLVRTFEGRAPNAADSSLSELLSRAKGQLQLALMIPEADESETGEIPGPAVVQGFVASMRQSPLGRLDSILFTLHAGSDLEVILEAAADTPENAAAVYDMLNGYLAMGKMMAAESPELGLVLDRLELDREEAVVSLSVSMTGDEIRTAIEQARQPEATATAPAGS